MFGENYIRSWLEERGEKKAVKSIITEYFLALRLKDCQPLIPAETLEEKLKGKEITLIFPIKDNPFSSLIRPHFYCVSSGRLTKIRSNRNSMIKQAERFGEGEHPFMLAYHFDLDPDSVSKFYCEKGSFSWKVVRGLNNKLPSSWPTGVYHNGKIYFIEENLHAELIIPSVPPA